MSRDGSIGRGVAAVASGALVVGAGGSVGALAEHMASGWAQEAARESAANVIATPAVEVVSPKPVVVTRIKKRHVTPDPVIIRKKVIVGVPAAPGAAPRAPSGSTSARPRPAQPSTRTNVAPAPRKQPSRTVVAPAPAPAPARTSGGTSAATTSKSS